RQSPLNQPASTSRFHHPYFTPAEVDFLSEKQRGKLSLTNEEKTRQSACSFLEAMGARIGFPRRTVATAQSLYHRFNLFFPRSKDYSYTMHDTLKKPRELLAVSYGIRNPELAARSKHPGGEVDLDTMDPQIVETDRQRLLTIERLMLETICFNFTSRLAFPYVIKMGRVLKASKKLTKFGWRIATDCHRTLLPLQYPPHTIALGSIYVAALLSSFEQPPEQSSGGFRTALELSKTLSTHGPWEEQFQSQAEDLDDIAHNVIDLFIQSSQNPSANTSPSTPSSPHPHSSHNRQPQVIQSPWKSEQLIRLKIAMRETELPPRKRQPLGTSDPSALYKAEDANLVGKNEGTVRFLFAPPGV
ncbi:cyclin-like protein, partial [Ephemerocybe angulata]